MALRQTGVALDLDATAAAWKKVAPATLDERRLMKKMAQPEHAYTGFVVRCCWCLLALR